MWLDWLPDLHDMYTASQPSQAASSAISITLSMPKSSRSFEESGFWGWWKGKGQEWNEDPRNHHSLSKRSENWLGLQIMVVELPLTTPGGCCCTMRDAIIATTTETTDHLHLLSPPGLGLMEPASRCPQANLNLLPYYGYPAFDPPITYSLFTTATVHYIFLPAW